MATCTIHAAVHATTLFKCHASAHPATLHDCSLLLNGHTTLFCSNVRSCDNIILPPTLLLLMLLAHGSWALLVPPVLVGHPVAHRLGYTLMVVEECKPTSRTDGPSCGAPSEGRPLFPATSRTDGPSLGWRGAPSEAVI